MPEDNNFQHSTYSRSNPTDRVGYRTLESGAPPDSPAGQEALAQAGKSLEKAGVRAIVLIYGSFLGTDLFGSGRLDEAGGLKRGYSRGIPGLESLLATLRSAANLQLSQDTPLSPPYGNNDETAFILDRLAGDGGSFSATYLKILEEGLNRGRSSSIPCFRYLWSSLHHHYGRIEAALALFEYLRALETQLELHPPHRILLLGHGHAGQVLSLLSNLITAGESSIRQMIFELLGEFYERTPARASSATSLQKLDQFLVSKEASHHARFDIITLGTPVRYGWETSTIGHLLHFVNHRVLRTDGKQWLAKMELPQIAWEVPTAMGGDYVQQLAVAGTDAVPPTPEEQEVNLALQELLEPYEGFERWLECARRVTRCHNDGQCLLVDYQDASDSPPITHLFGHACYTRLTAMLFHLREIVQALYA